MKIPQIFRNTENGGRAKDFQRQSLPRSLLTFHFELSFQWRAQWSHCALLCNRQRQQFLFVSDKVNTHQWLFVIVCLLSTIFTYLRGRRTRITTRKYFSKFVFGRYTLQRRRLCQCLPISVSSLCIFTLVSLLEAPSGAFHLWLKESQLDY